jgi:hypothetical protein
MISRIEPEVRCGGIGLLCHALLLATAPQALAAWSYMTDDALYASCTSSAEWDIQGCQNYIMGVSDGIDLLQGGYPDWDRGVAPLVCSRYLSGRELKDVVVAYLKDRGNRHTSAAEAVVFSLENAYPCKKRP